MLLKLLVILIFGPVILALLAQSAITMFAMVLPWILAAGAVAGVAGGLTAALVLKRYLRLLDDAPRVTRREP